MNKLLVIGGLGILFVVGGIAVWPDHKKIVDDRADSSDDVVNSHLAVDANAEEKAIQTSVASVVLRTPGREVALRVTTDDGVSPLKESESVDGSVNRPDEWSPLIAALAGEDDLDAAKKSAKRLGDAALHGAFTPNPEQLEQINAYVQSQVELTGSAVGTQWSDANLQIQRLWTLAVPELIEGLSHPSIAVQEAASKNLILMRNEDVVRQIISLVEESNDQRVQAGGIMTLGMMTNRRHTPIAGREQMGEEHDAEIVGKYIVPFLNKLRASEQNAEIKKVVEIAMRYLANPIDYRPRLISIE